MIEIHNKELKRPSSWFTGLITLLILAGSLTGIVLLQPESTQAAAIQGKPAGIESSLAIKTFLPVMYKQSDNGYAFGIESLSSFYSGNFISSYASQLHVNYARMNDRISWIELQPNETDPINWSSLANFESELRTLRAANINPIIVVDDYPRWATVYATSCGPIWPERYDDFAVFMQALVMRYSTPEFNVHYWELGNEPDVDHRLVPIDNFFGCWGLWSDPFYNGRTYGNMLKVVTPAIRAADPTAQVLIGGLLLASPNTVDDYTGQPEDFFRGILEAGAGPYFDIVAYHSYVAHSGVSIDRDITSGTAWDAWGGMLRGKANFLRSIMAQYGVTNKQFFITETSQLCSWCQYDPALLPGMYDFQANLAPRSFPRAIASGITGFIWYTLEGPGWYYSSLLDENQVPKPAYYSYQTMLEMIGSATLIGPVSYGTGIEAYTFHRGAFRIDIVFAVEDTVHTIYIPQAGYLSAFDRFGNLITPTATGSDNALTIQYEPIYIVRSR